MTTIELTLPTMSCGHCVKTVTQTAQRLDPQAQVRIDLATRRAVFETQVARELLEQALAAEGYPPAASR